MSSENTPARPRMDPIQWVQANQIVLAVVAVQVAVLAILLIQLQGVRDQIGAADAQRQADARALNTRVTMAEQLFLARPPQPSG